jgi:hypothetical protein
MEDVFLKYQQQFSWRHRPPWRITSSPYQLAASGF